MSTFVLLVATIAQALASTVIRSSTLRKGAHKDSNYTIMIAIVH